MVIIRKKQKESAEEKEARLRVEQERSLGIQDQYQARGFEMVTWVQDNKVLVSCFIAALFVGGAAFSGYLYYQKRSAEIASSDFLAAVKGIEAEEEEPAKNKDKLKEAQVKLAEVASTHRRTGVSGLANLYAGHLALENGDAKQAVEYYDAAVKELGSSNDLYPLGLIGLGDAREKNGDSKAALSEFEAVIALKDGIGADLALWKAARIAHQLQENEKAKKYLARLLEEHPASSFEKDAKRLKDSIH